MIDVEASLLGGSLGCLPLPIGILFYSRYAVRGWNSRAVAIHLEHDVRVVGSKILRRPTSGAPTAFKARGRVSI